MSIRAAVSIVTLGVADIAKSQDFYSSLGWQVIVSSDDGLRVFRTDGAWLALYPRDSLAEDAGTHPSLHPGFRDIALALNLESPQDVDAVFELVMRSGGSVLKAPEQKTWGGYSGYIQDPDGHTWEIAYNPSWPIGPDGRPLIVS